MKPASKKSSTLHRRQFHRRVALSAGSLIAAANLGQAAPKQPVPQFELFEQKLQLPKDVEQKIYRDNARRVLELNT